MTARDDLPLIDEHVQLVKADLPSAWNALLATLEVSRHARSRSLGARLLRCAETSSNGLPLEEPGATAPGFRVTEVVPQSRLALRGRHRYSRYALDFELKHLSATATSVSALTRASFPGVAGRLYGRAVIDSRIHVVAVGATLRAIRRQAEKAPASPTRVAAA